MFFLTVLYKIFYSGSWIGEDCQTWRVSVGVSGLHMDDAKLWLFCGKEEISWEYGLGFTVDRVRARPDTLEVMLAGWILPHWAVFACVMSRRSTKYVPLNPCLFLGSAQLLVVGLARRHHFSLHTWTSLIGSHEICFKIGLLQCVLEGPVFWGLIKLIVNSAASYLVGVARCINSS